MTSSRPDLTYRHNKLRGRHGWLRLTPAYSVRVVEDLLAAGAAPCLVLDPFSGSGTTGLVCAEQGISCHVAELNPFLAWLTRAKTRGYSDAALGLALHMAVAVVAEAQALPCSTGLWVPPIKNVERWWLPPRLEALARLFHGLRARRDSATEAPALDLLLIAFCGVALSWSNAAFNHQSMSFSSGSSPSPDDVDRIAADFRALVERMSDEARPDLPGGVTVYEGDSRAIDQIVPGRYDCVITSPPYPNRMSYIRELRPHMYWLGYLTEARQAADLDWEAIGGTWGVATSRLARWSHAGLPVAQDGFAEMIERIRAASPLLANYVYKYVVDMTTHLRNLRAVLAPGARVHYIVGNSTFYHVLVPVERIYAGILHELGFHDVTVDVLRKRSSKKELLEFVVSATWH